jgi:lipopolysaccharide/colanic/teichoic acid biosynthesis glycosyltransferase
MTAHRNGKSSAEVTTVPAPLDGILSETQFGHALYVERKRAERSGRKFVLMLLESARLLKPDGDRGTLEQVVAAITHSSRDTDTKGWHKTGTTIGVIYTEIAPDLDGRVVANALLTKVTTALTETLSINQINEIRLIFRVFPDEFDRDRPAGVDEMHFYDELLHEHVPGRLSRITKRFMDLLGSLLALLIGAPLFLAIAVAIKLTSRGPVLFSQKRTGLYGRRFNFLKFRSMYVDTDETIHREFVREFIATGRRRDGGNGRTEFKLSSDPRITPIGRFLRRSSLDELPQFLNVLMGDMSLVGPRPPLPYEVDCYHIWHRTRLLAAKPGITGLWQVVGRSRVQFDDMVRLDLRYAKSWSIWLDIKILARTPHAVVSANGAR